MHVKPRTKFYGSGVVHSQLARDLLCFRVHKGQDVATFERRAADYFGSKYAVAVPLARVGIYLCLKYYCKPEQLVLQSPYTLLEVINMTICAGCTPLFSDVDAANGHLDPRSLTMEKNVGALLVTHLHGIPAELDEITALAARRNIPVIEDAAQSAGAKYGGKYVGTHGEAGVLSFGIYKQMNSIYGGLVLTRDSGLAEYLRDKLSSYRRASNGLLLGKAAALAKLQALTSQPFFSWAMFPLLRHGVVKQVDWINRLTTVETEVVKKTKMDDWYRHQMTPSQARMLLKQLPQLAQQDKARVDHARRYREMLKPTEGLVLSQPPENSEPTYAQFPIQVPDAGNLLRWLNFYRQDVVAQHFFNCAEVGCFSEYARDCPEASRVARSLILLPTYPGFGVEHVDRNAQIVNRYFEHGQPRFDETDQLGMLP